MNEVSKKIRQEIENTVVIKPETHHVLKIMARFNEIHSDFYEWLGSYYGDDNEQQKEFSNAYEGMYFYLEETLCNLIRENMNSLPFKGI